jgi:FkbM family methyltransferase
MDAYPLRTQYGADVRTVGDLLVERRVNSLATLLEGYRRAGFHLANAMDGGAGSGHIAKAMLPYLSGEIFAFEPFSGNHRFFVGADRRIRLMPFALCAEAGMQSFEVPSVVAPDSTWGRKGLAGYSSVGRIVEDGGSYAVPCVRGDDAVLDWVDFVKLDVQGGELNALRGMPRILSEARFLWIEYMGSESLLTFLLEQDFVLFDTEYLLLEEPDESIFSISADDVALSTGKTAWKAYRRDPWHPYDEVFREQQETGLVQTDLVCVKADRLDELTEALEYCGN